MSLQQKKVLSFNGENAILISMSLQKRSQICLNFSYESVALIKLGHVGTIYQGQFHRTLIKSFQDYPALLLMKR